MADTEKQPLTPLLRTNDNALPIAQHPPSSPFRRIFRSLNLRFLAILLIYLIFHHTTKTLKIFQQDLQVPPLSPTFLKHCDSLLKPTPTTYLDRLSRLTKALSLLPSHGDLPGQAVWISEPGPSVEYYLGAFGPGVWHPSERPFLIAITPSLNNPHSPNITLLTPAFEELRASIIPIPSELKEHITWVAWREDESPYKVLLDHLRGSIGGGVIDGATRSFIAAGIATAAKEISTDREGGVEILGLGLGSVEREEGLMKSVREAVDLIRERKDEREIGSLRCANQMTLHAIRKTRQKMRFGITEKETGIILRQEMAKTGLRGGDGLILFGENAALPHGSGTNRLLGKEDFVLIDAGGTWGGYTSDITRTFALPGSKIPREHLEIWEIVRRAQYAPFELLMQSNTTSPPQLGSLDKAARGVITKGMAHIRKTTAAEFDSENPDYTYMTHRLGHGIGLEGHEAPYLVQGPLGAKTVQTGHVFSLEPGIYIPKEDNNKNNISGVGVRLEDCFVVMEDKEGKLGGEWLSGPVLHWGDI